jgi:hypothetical protein
MYRRKTRFWILPAEENFERDQKKQKKDPMCKGKIISNLRMKKKTSSKRVCTSLQYSDNLLIEEPAEAISTVPEVEKVYQHESGTTVTTLVSSFTFDEPKPSIVQKPTATDKNSVSASGSGNKRKFDGTPSTSNKVQKTNKPKTNHKFHKKKPFTKGKSFGKSKK